MSNISTDKIKELREKSGAGMMDCKNALLENNGDLEKSISWLRKKGISNAEKKSTRIASEGLIGIISNKNNILLIEINTETDFVSKNNDFQTFFKTVLDIGIAREYDLPGLLLENYNNVENIGEALQNLIAKIGENIVIRRLEYLSKDSDEYEFGFYLHNKINNNLGKMGCITKIYSSKRNSNISDLANKICMHITAFKPLAIDENGISKDKIDNEKEIYITQLKDSGKPANIIEKIVEGKIKKYFSEVTLLNQPWVMDPSVNVAKVIEDFNVKNTTDVKIDDFKLFVLGEGIEVEEKNFSEEVASQIKNTT